MRRAALSCVLSCVACALLVAVAGAQDGDPDTTPEPTPPPAEPAELSPEEQARRAKVVARVGETAITLGEVEDAINEQSPFMRARYRDREQLETFVGSMIRFELLARAAERAEIDEDPEVQRVVKQTAVQQLIRREFDERFRPDTVPMEDVRSYYEGHPSEFTREEMRRASHIQVATREEAERLLTEVREADTRTFRTLARERSVDAETRLRGGDLRYFDAEGRARNTRDPRVDEALAAAAFGLEEVGDVAGPIAVGDHFSVVKLTGTRPAEHRTLEQAEPTIRLRLWRSQRQQRMDDFVARLRREAGVEASYDLLAPIRLDEPEREDDEAAAPGAAAEGEAEPAEGEAAEAE